MLTTPFGSIHITIDDREIEYVAVKLPLGRHFYSGATGRYAIRIDLVPDGAEHNIDCRLIEIPSNVEGWSNSGEDIECMTFNTGITRQIFQLPVLEKPGRWDAPQNQWIGDTTTTL